MKPTGAERPRPGVSPSTVAPGRYSSRPRPCSAFRGILSERSHAGAAGPRLGTPSSDAVPASPSVVRRVRRQVRLKCSPITFYADPNRLSLVAQQITSYVNSNAVPLLFESIWTGNICQ
jgi:hypothetical protein